jgi:hypothetical protein
MTTDSGEKRNTAFARSKLGPPAALISFFGTVAALVSIFVPKEGLPPVLVILVAIVTFVFYLVALMTSSVAFLELLSDGLPNAGTLKVGKGHLEGWPLGLLYAVTYLMPWLLILGAVTFGVLLRSR